MKKESLTKDDLALVEAALKAAKTPVRQHWGKPATPYVATALRLDDGKIITATNMTADINSLSLCAEPQAIAEANRHVDRKITTIVAVYHLPGHEPKVIPPCGRCREIVTDFITDGFVILRDPGTKDLYKVHPRDILPLKHADYWKGEELV